MALTAGELNRATLARQLLLERTSADVGDAVRRLVALQAQAPPSPYLALWNRIADLDPAAVDAAFADGTLVKATLLRITLHAVHTDDHATLHLAMQPTLRAARLGDQRFLGEGLTVADADGSVAAVLGFLDQPRRNDEVQDWLAARGYPGKPLWWALRHYAPVRHAVTGGPWSFDTRPQYLTAGLTPPDPGDRQAAEVALRELILRYLDAFGPATVADAAQFALVQRSRVRAAVADIGDRLERLTGPDGEDLLDVPDGVRPPADIPAPPRLLGMWDSVLLAYHDRSRVIPPDVRPLVIRRNGDVLPTLLVDGRVAGVWRATEAAVEAAAFNPLPETVWADLEAEASQLCTILAARDPSPYARYHHWFDKLPDLRWRVLASH